MPRFFKEDFEANPILEGDDAKHLIKSLRVRIGEQITVCDTKGADYNCTVEEISSDTVNLKINEILQNKTEPSVKVTLFQCLPKADKMDTVIKQSVELGVSEIVPVLSTNCVSRPDEKSISKKIERRQKIANEAAGQSGRGILPKVKRIQTLKEVSSFLLKDFDRAYFCYEKGTEPFKNLEKGVNSVAVIIGSEGGFTEEEAKMLEENGALVTTLGPRILRTETAPLAALSVIMFATENFTI